MADTSGTRAKPSTRSSIRQTLNFASVGKMFEKKALADVINNSDKMVKQPSRELRGVGSKPRASLDSRPSPPPSKRSRTPDSKTITARRRSSLAIAPVSHRTSADDPSPGSSRVTPQPSAPTRSSTLRPRPGSASNLPKYRPKSIIVENGKKPGSPGLSGSRKRMSTSDDDEDKTSSHEMVFEDAVAKDTRPISPLPARAAKPTNIGSAKSKVPSPKRTTPTVRNVSPNHLPKVAKVAGSIPRPSSSSSSSSSFTPKTPKTSTDKISALPESPLVRHVRQRSKTATPPVQETGNMSHISEVNSDDEDDVEILLAPTAALGAPTPAMPRLQPLRTRTRLVPATPTKPGIPIHFDPPQASSTPPKNQGSPSFLRPSPSPGSDRSIRGGSILSWEQLATEASRTIPVDELGTMLSDMSAPFQPGPLSPMPTGNDSMLLDAKLPSTPGGLSAFNSPSGYGSISQVLLPNVTPSPAISRHSHSHSQRINKESAVLPAVDTAIATLLRLQLSSTENTARERLLRLQELEEEIHLLKQARAREAEVLSQQVSILEAQLKGNIEARDRSEEEHFAYTASLEEQLHCIEAQHEQALREATENTRQSFDASCKSAIESQNRKMAAEYSACLAAREWRCVQEQCESELDVVAADRETLELLLGELDFARQQLSIL